MGKRKPNYTRDCFTGNLLGNASRQAPLGKPQSLRLDPVLCPLSSVLRPREALLRNLNPSRNLRSSPSAAKTLSFPSAAWQISIPASRPCPLPSTVSFPSSAWECLPAKLCFATSIPPPTSGHPQAPPKPCRSQALLGASPCHKLSLPLPPLANNKTFFLL